ncbi:MAG: GyrI-like domain-containing protein, partial [Clostridia bacterium]|nr:GyrI-like domain-containing protein [Clostridia bacterium]
YNFPIGTVIPRYFTEHLEKTVGEGNARQLQVLHIPAGRYLIVETERSAFSINEHLDVRKCAVSEWFPGAAYELSEAPEITVFHSDPTNSQNSYTELWLPIRSC